MSRGNRAIVRRLERWADAAGVLGPMAEMPDKAMPTAEAPEAVALARHMTRTPDHTQRLVALIEDALIPRIAAAHAGEPPAAAIDPRAAALVELLLHAPAFKLRHFVERLRASGLGLDELYLAVLTPAARRLGELWSTDEIDFTEVTAGLGRLQHLVADLSPTFIETAPVDARRCMLAAVPHAQHTLGLVMVADFFRRAGWTVAGDPAMDETALTARLAAEHLDLVGFSIGTERHVFDLERLAAVAKRKARNRDLKVIVGGPLAVERPDLVTVPGVDGIATNAPEAVCLAERLVRGGPA